MVAENLEAKQEVSYKAGSYYYEDLDLRMPTLHDSCWFLHTNPVSQHTAVNAGTG